jgi:lysophospholipase L1-like esterase
MPPQKNLRRAALVILPLLLATIADAVPIDKKLVVAGSSVPAGQGTYFAGTYTDDFDNNAGTHNLYAIYGYAGRLRLLLTNPVDPSLPPLGPGDGESTTAWTFRNVSIPGNNTGALDTRFNPDVTSEDPEYVLIALSMGNEGLAGSGDPDGVLETFRDGMLGLISDVEAIGAQPVIGLVYPKATYNYREYGFVKEINLLMNTWDVPSINLLGAIDDGRGQWAEGFYFDDAHPNYPGHEEMFHAIVPSLFDALETGKTTPPYPSSNGFARITQDVSEAAPIQFTPSHTFHAFTSSFKVRSGNTGTVAAVRAKSEPKILIDFGPNADVDGRATTGADAFGRYWNSWRPGAAGANEIGIGTSLSNLIDVDNTSTSMGVEVTWPFRGSNGINAGGLTNPSEDELGSLAVDTATEDYFYVESGVNSSFGVMKLTGLDTNKTYTIRLFGTRNNSTQTRRTRYTVKAGLSYEPFAFLPTSGESIGSDRIYDGNDSEVVLFANIPPDSNGAIEVIVAVEEGSFAYIGALELSEDAATDRFGTIELRDTEIAYIAPDGREISYATNGDGGIWHDVALSHRFAAQDTLLYVDGNLAGTLRESFEPDQFILGGSGSAGSDSPTSADYQDWCIYRAAWTPEEALAHHNGALQQASLEVLAPLSDGSFTVSGSVANDAQSLATAIVNSANVAVGNPVNAPSDLTGDSYASSSIDLSWIDNSLTETNFILERRPSGGNQAWSIVATIPADPTNGTVFYTDSGLNEGTAYDYRVSTDESGTRSDYSNILTIAAGGDGESYREWADGFFNLPDTSYRIDFNTSPSPDYGGEIWNTVSSLSSTTPYILSDTSGDDSANYMLTVTDAFNDFRPGNGSELSDYPADAQSTYFVVKDPLQPDGAQIKLSGLNRNATYRISLFGRRAGPIAGFDYVGRYTLTGGGEALSYELDCAELNDRLASRAI